MTTSPISDRAVIAMPPEGKKGISPIILTRYRVSNWTCPLFLNNWSWPLSSRFLPPKAAYPFIGTYDKREKYTSIHNPSGASLM
jgi:hypothetical protein